MAVWCVHSVCRPLLLVVAVLISARQHFSSAQDTTNLSVNLAGSPNNVSSAVCTFTAPSFGSGTQSPTIILTYPDGRGDSQVFSNSSSYSFKLTGGIVWPGNYTCQENQSSPVVWFLVEAPTVVLNSSEKVAQLPSTNVIIRCNAAGTTPFYSLKWTLDNGESIIDGTQQAVSETTVDLRVAITNTTADIKYKCTAESAAGNDSATVLVARRQTPGAPRLFNLTIISNTMWNFSWEAGFDGNVDGPLKYILFVQGPTLMEIGPTTDTSVLLDPTRSLLPFKDYSFEIVPQNLQGNGSASALINQTTPESRPSPPLSFSTTVVSSDSVLCRWLAPSTPNGVVIGYTLTVAWNLTAERPNTTNISVAGYLLNYTVTSLLPHTMYMFAIAASTSAGSGNFGSLSLVTTSEAQSGPPVMLNAIPSGAGALNVSWSKPTKPYGVVTMYTISYRTLELPNRYPVSCNQYGQQAVSSVPSPLLDTILSGLCYYTAYNISVAAANGAGPGEVASTVQRTNEHAPTPPRNIAATPLSSSSIHCSWVAPEFPNGVIRFYTLQACNASGNCVNSTSSGDRTLANITSLQPFANYTISVLAGTRAGSSSFARQPGRVQTFGSLPPPVTRPATIDAMTYTGSRPLQTTSSLLFRLTRPSDRNGPVSFFQVLALEVNASSSKNLQLPDEAYGDALGDVAEYAIGSTRNPGGRPWVAAEFEAANFPGDSLFNLGDRLNSPPLENKRYNGPLKPETKYVVALRVFVEVAGGTQRRRRSIIPLPMRKYDAFKTSLFSEARTTEKQPEPPTGLSPSAVIGISLAVTFILIGAVVFGLIVVYYKHVVKQANISHGTPGAVFRREPEEPAMPRQMSMRSAKLDWMSVGSVPADKFADHVKRMHANDNYFFSQEYEIITTKSPQPSYEVCGAPDNRSKNRYANILCYDDTRVILSEMREDDGDTTYINANYIDGFEKEKAYIATQGPVPESIDDFWRMIWEENSYVIVMLTNLEERGRLKCNEYWPNSDSKTYGQFEVHHVETLTLPDSVERTFSMEMVGGNRSREIKQYHYSSWPDHGVPEQASPLLNFMKRVRAAVPPNTGPLVVHCSAGVGRTGTYIVIEAELQRLKAEKNVDIFNCLRHIRSQRNFMVQTEAQYVFVHDAILEASRTPHTEVSVTELQKHYRDVLNHENPPEGAWNLKRQFEHLNSTCQSPVVCKAGSETMNRKKNRSPTVLPIESSRVKLRVIPGVIGSDYINASFVSGYSDRSAFIVTQGPMQDTVNDFWRMTWEQQSHNIVMLTDFQEDGESICSPYWPDESKPTLYGDYLVSKEGETTFGDFVVRDLLVTCTKQQETVSRPIKHFQYTTWPSGGKPSAGADIIHMLGQIQKVQQATNNKSIVVHCSTGLGRVGVFCGLSICVEQVKADGVLDVYQAIKAIRSQRPGLVRTVEQYQFIYEAILQYLESFEMYANFK